MNKDTEEPTYTLAEAQRVMALRECASHGHSWDVVSTFDGFPVSINCGTCGWFGEVQMHERPTR